MPPGQHGLGREAVQRSQRERLQRAMVAAVAEQGYARTKIRDLARLAGVSPNAFYELYESKEECFLAAHDAVARLAIERVSAAATQAEGWRERLRLAFSAFIDTVIEQPDAAYLAVVETHAVGSMALKHQQKALDAHERMMRQCLELAPHGKAISDTTVKAIVCGTRSIVYHHVGSGHPQQLRGLVEPILDWVESYHSEAGARVPDAIGSRRAAVRLPRPPRSAARAEREQATLGHRERIMRAVAALTCEDSYQALRVEAINARAGVSSQTFYEHFKNKHDAFLACYDRVSRRALGATMTSFQAAASWPEAIQASLQTLLGFVAAEPEFARLGFFEVLAAGPTARRRAEARMEGFSAILDPGFEQSERPPPHVVSALIAGGIAGVIQYHMLHGPARRLPELTPQLTYVALTPFIGAERAADVAVGPLQPGGPDPTRG